MINEIVGLSDALREKGLAVSIRSSETAYKTYKLIGNNDRQLLKTALRSVYVKNKYDISKFNKVFEELFKEDESYADEDIIKKKANNIFKNAKNNKYYIKKKKGNSKSNKKQLLENYKIKELSNLPRLEEFEEIERDGELLNKDLTKLNKFDSRMLDLCQELGRKIANKRSRRRNISKSMKVDIRKTMRTNIKYGGVPLKLIKSKPRPHKNEHIFLNDISGSCEWISSWFFMLMYAAQTSFKNSKTFEFDSKTIETTNALKEQYLLNAFIKVRDKRIKNAMIHGSSNMYSAFNSFLKKVNLSNKSYVIILSDCRDWAGPKYNNIPKSVYLIEKMVSSSKKVIILNPENRNKWDVVDSCVSLYRNAGAQVFEVNTLNQLANFVATM